ncbi:hypothetical protein ACFX13_017465 [Malus domestica]
MRAWGANRNCGRDGDQSGTSNGHAGGAPVDKDVDFANYLCTYAFLYHQKEKLSDRLHNYFCTYDFANLLKKILN